jgi:3-methyladenine DNA glycosylase Mpg
MLRVQGAFVNDSSGTGPLTYELDVQRTGDAGTSQSTQSGRFETAPGQTDTLSTVRVNVQPGDEATLRLVIRRDETVVDEVRQQRTF